MGFIKKIYTMVGRIFPGNPHQPVPTYVGVTGILPLGKKPAREQDLQGTFYKRNQVLDPQILFRSQCRHSCEAIK